MWAWIIRTFVWLKYETDSKEKLKQIRNRSNIMIVSSVLLIIVVATTILFLSIRENKSVKLIVGINEFSLLPLPILCILLVFFCS